MIGQILSGRYKVSTVLGAGGMGRTYVAHDMLRPGHPTCVVKQLRPASEDPGVLEIARRLFATEAEILERLGNHDQLPRLLAYFEQEQEFYLVQEYIDGHPLSFELAQGQLWTEERVIVLLQEILTVLAFIHEQNVIHRDIKPDNIIRRKQDNKLVLIDFGAVKQVRLQQPTIVGQSSVTVAIGTPGYMPTEQSSGKPRPSSDIYAVGMIGIQALTGILPTYLHEDDDGKVLWQHLTQVSDDFAQVINKMVRHYFKHRYQSATDVLIALEGLDTFPSMGSPTPLPTNAAAVAYVPNAIVSSETIQTPHQPNKNLDSRINNSSTSPSLVSLPESAPTYTTEAKKQRRWNSVFDFLHLLGTSTPTIAPDATIFEHEASIKRTPSGKILVLREQAQQFQAKFAESLVQREKQPIVFHVYGIGGVGKTTLLQELEQENAQKAYFAWVYFDVHQGVDTPLKLMQKLYEEVTRVTKPGFWQQEVLPPPDPFTSIYTKYQETLDLLEAQPIEGKEEISSEQINTIKQLAKFCFGAVGQLTSVPGISASTLEKLGETSVDAAVTLLQAKEELNKFLQQHRATRKKRELRELMLDPLAKLTEAFVSGLVSKAKKHPIVLMLDTFEKANPDINAWLQFLLANTNLKNYKIRLVISGRYSLLKTEGWQRLYQNWQLIDEYHLPSLSENQTEIYLRQININQSSQIKGAYRTTRGLPYYLNWICEQKAKGIELDFSKGHDDIGDVLLLKRLNDKQKKVVQLASCCRWLDLHVLSYLIEQKGKELKLDTSNDSGRNWFTWLRQQQDFVKVSQYRCYLDDVARELFRFSLWLEDQKLFYQVHTLLSDYFRSQAERFPSGASIENSDLKLFAAEAVYHKFFSHPEEQPQFLQDSSDPSPFNEAEVIRVAFTAIAAENDIESHPFLFYQAKKTLTEIRNTIISSTTQTNTDSTHSA
ncbi:protein kinase domain-containing protein [Egbenema bharatensis]|uniref:protein kinase domain-containing protein n=1 Tax=Egbenema bharatensis TaxID=3463334 RepID=UPI003A87DC3F